MLRRSRVGAPLRTVLHVLVTLVVCALAATPALAVRPDDPRLADVWAFDGDAPMGIDSAWDQTVGGDVVVAILDTGIDLSHPDLRDNLWTNPGEIPGNGRDDDGNGYVDDVHGADVVSGDGVPQDDNGHGTHVAGIIAARGGNGIGTAGVAWRARIMPVKVLDGGAGGDTGGVARGVDYAISKGARIINLSLAGNQRSPVLDDALQRAQDAGILVVAAAGNQHRDLAILPSWPAASPLDNVVSVAATTVEGLLASISSFGSPVDLAAPGDLILSTALGGDYEWRTGTSMASPMVAGVATLVASVAPTADWRTLRDAVVGGARRTVLPIGGGTVDATGALRRVIPADRWRAPGAAAPAPTTTGARTTPTATASAARERDRQAKALAAATADAKAEATHELRRSRLQARSARLARSSRGARSRALLPGVVPVRAA